MEKDKQQEKLEHVQKEMADVKADIRFLKKVMLEVNFSQDKEQNKDVLSDLEKELKKL